MPQVALDNPQCPLWPHCRIFDRDRGLDWKQLCIKTVQGPVLLLSLLLSWWKVYHRPKQCTMTYSHKQDLTAILSGSAALLCFAGTLCVGVPAVLPGWLHSNWFFMQGCYRCKRGPSADVGDEHFNLRVIFPSQIVLLESKSVGVRVWWAKIWGGPTERLSSLFLFSKSSCL